MKIKVLGATLAILLVLGPPILTKASYAQAGSDDSGISSGNDDDDDDDSNGNGVPDDEEGAGPGTGGMEAECAATARPEICLSYFQFNCQRYGFPAACNLAALGSNCMSGGDPAQCQYFMNILRANTACLGGDQNACVYINQQPITQQ